MNDYSIFVFGKLFAYEYIRYSYSMKFSFTNIFVFGQEFDIRLTRVTLFLRVP